MKRQAEKWRNCNPAEMAKQSEAAIMYAFQDAITDILRMAEVLRVIGYPQRGTDEESMNLDNIAKYVHENFSMDDLAT